MEIGGEIAPAAKSSPGWYLPFSILMLLLSIALVLRLPFFFFPLRTLQQEKNKQYQRVVTAYEEGRWEAVTEEADKFLRAWPRAAEESDVYFRMAMAWTVLAGPSDRAERDKLGLALEAFTRVDTDTFSDTQRRNVLTQVANLSERLGRPAEQQVHLFEEIVRSFPDLADQYWYKLASAYLQISPPRESRALACLTALLSKEKIPLETRTQALLLQGKMYLKLNDFSKARSSLEATKQSATDPLVLKETEYWIARVDFLSGKTEQTRRAFSALLSQKPADADLDARVLFLLANCDLQQGRKEEAEERFLKLVATVAAPDLKAALLVRLTQMDIGRGKAPQARERFFSLLDTTPKRYIQNNIYVSQSEIRSAFDQILVYYRDRRNYDELRAVTEEALKTKFLRPDDGLMTKGLIILREASDLASDAEALKARGKEAEAEGVESRARQLFSAAGGAFEKLTVEDVGRGYYTLGLFNAGKARFMARQYNQAASLLQRFLDVNDREGMAEARFLLGRSRQYLGEYREAIGHYQINEKRFPNHFFTYQSRLEEGVCLQSLAQYSRAAEVFKGIIDDPERPFGRDALVWRQAAIRLGESLYRAGRLEEAWVWLENAVTWYKDLPNWLELNYYLGCSLLECGRSDAARKAEFIDRAVTYFAAVADKGQAPGIGPEKAEFIRWSAFAIGDARLLAEDYSKAIDGYTEAIGRYPDSVEAVRALVKAANCCLRLNQKDRAAGLFERAQLSYGRLTGSGKMLAEPWMELALWRKAAEPSAAARPGT